MGEKISKEYLRAQDLKLWNEGDLTVLDELYELDFIRTEPFEGVINGREAMANHVMGLRRQYPDIKVTTIEDIFDGSIYVSRWRLEGTDTGDFEDRPVPPTNKKVDILGTSIFHLEDDKIIDEYCYYDLLLVLQQLGLMPETIG